MRRAPRAAVRSSLRGACGPHGLTGSRPRPCRDLNELRHLVALLYDRYRAPVEAGEVAAENTAALYKRQRPTPYECPLSGR